MLYLLVIYLLLTSVRHRGIPFARVTERTRDEYLEKTLTDKLEQWSELDLN